MNYGRRDFIKYTGILATGIISVPFDLFAGKNKPYLFSPRLGICTELNNSQILIDAKYEYIEEGVRRFLVPDQPESVFLEKLELLKNSGISLEACNSFLPGELKCVGADLKHKEILEFVEIAFRRAQQAGIKIIVFGSGAARSIPDGFSRDEAQKQFIELGRKMAEIASKYNVIICLEPLHSGECNFINKVSEGGEIVKLISHKNFRLLADIWHMRKENESPESIVKYGKYLRHVHIAELEGRLAPGSTSEDFTPYFYALKKIEYSGRISIECGWKNIERQAGIAKEALEGQINKVNY